MNRVRNRDGAFSPRATTARTLALALLTFACAFGAPRSAPPLSMRLYALDCGRLDFKNLGPVSDTDDYVGQQGTMAVPCFLIRHNNVWMLWDAGLGDDVARLPGGKDEFGFHWTVTKTLRAQLAQLGLKPGDIKFVGLSHVHADHIGNVGLFPHATLLVSPLDLAWGKDTPPEPSIDPKLFRTLLRMKTSPVPYDLDVFGDGSVRMIRTSGHTPGHHSLLLNLPHSGRVFLTGDLYHFREDRRRTLMTTINSSRAETLASMQRFEALVKKYHARVVIQHDPNDFAALPAFPRFLD